jgi:hypothetical protein
MLLTTLSKSIPPAFFPESLDNGPCWLVGNGMIKDHVAVILRPMFQAWKSKTSRAKRMAMLYAIKFKAQ